MPASLPPPPPAIVWVQEQRAALPAGKTDFPCDEAGIIRCVVDEKTQTQRQIEDMRTIAHYIWLLAERNRRFYVAWQEKLPSAAYEVVRRIRQFPYLPYGDMYSIQDMQLFIDEDSRRISVRYPKRPNDTNISEQSEDDYVTYGTDLAPFMKAVTREIDRLKKYEKG
jgi:hypothetical protein